MPQKERDCDQKNQISLERPLKIDERCKTQFSCFDFFLTQDTQHSYP